jgi:uncharacterized protein
VRPFRSARAILPVVAACLVFLSCRSPRALRKDIRPLLAQGRSAEAVSLVKNAKTTRYGPKNALLYHLDLGMLLHLDGEYVESNMAFEEAKRLSQELFTKSVTREASTFLVSDNTRPYYGEDFERALIHVFSALNYVFLNQGMEALVEARQVDFLLAKLETDHGHKNVYREDAFARYLMGLIYENQGEINDAYISYRKALEAYETYKKHYGVSAPSALVQDALRTAVALGFQDRVAEIQRRWGGETPGPLPEGAGEVIVLHYNGLIPEKTDSFFEIGFIAGWAYVEAERPVGEEQEQVSQAASVARSLLADEVVRMAFPAYVDVPYRIRSMTVRAEVAHATHTASVAQDIGAIAKKNLQDRIGRVRAKTIARAVVKFALSQRLAARVGEERGAGAAWLTKKVLQVASSATELADKRSWETLPDEIAVARVVLPAGTHDLHLEFRDQAGALVESRDIKGVEVKSGRKTFAALRTAQ